MKPAELAGLIKSPPPTEEQAAVIGAPMGPAVVIAGAGSGKTETMASRVLWLVANGFVEPERVLGLTFTTKAAAELGQRLRARLAQLRVALKRPPSDGEPTVLTYHAYAARLVGEHALRLAVEPSSRLLTEASTWQVAARVVHAYDGDLPHVQLAESSVVDRVLSLAEELGEHLRTPEELIAWSDDLVGRIEPLPRAGARSGPYADVRKLLDAAQARAELMPVVQRYREAKRASGVVDFGDQMSLAARIARDVPQVGEIERERYSVVLLDEYQDTSEAQLVLMRSLYATGHPVTAVGDPCQSIYGWRGASAGNLGRFPEHFAADGEPAPALPLTTSFRNDRQILTVANRLAEPLGVVRELRPGPTSEDGVVRAGLFLTADDEAEWIADEIATHWSKLGEGRSVAVLARRRTSFPRLGAALRARGLPVELVGLGGLLATPEVRDVVSTLRVLSDPGAGDAMVRLLTGPRWRLGPRDLMALGRRARRLARRDLPEGATADDASLLEAIDDLGDPDAYSPEGHRRLETLRGELAALRRRTGASLPELVADVERTIGVDVEVVATGGTRAHLDRFLDVAAQFAEDSEVATLAAFVAYLDAAEREERGLEPGEVVVEEDRVQVLTVHGAKGLEWDVVAVAGMSEGVFPDTGRGSSGWSTAVGALPYPLRGDAHDLPALDLDGVVDQKDVEEARKTFVAGCRARALVEERRLAYVALTRARKVLLCSGFRWDDGVTKPRMESAFLAEVRDAGAEVVGWEPLPDDGTPNPLQAADRSVAWPRDPLGDKRKTVDEAASLVRAGDSDDDAELQLFDPEAAAWDEDVTLLLAERAAGPRSRDVPLPEQLSVSRLVDLRRDPAALARRIRRPMPSEPSPLARRGTAFHAWLEERYGVARLLDIDELPGAADEGARQDGDLVELQQKFLSSEWAERRPYDVEVPFETRLGAVVVRGRMDAVFRDDDGGFTVVDWKTGDERSGDPVQLAAYRLAWSRLEDVPLERVRAAFHYVRSGTTLRPADLLDEPGLLALFDQVASSTSATSD